MGIEEKGMETTISGLGFRRRFVVPLKDYRSSMGVIQGFYRGYVRNI